MADLGIDVSPVPKPHMIVLVSELGEMLAFFSVCDVMRLPVLYPTRGPGVIRHLEFNKCA